MTFAKHIAVAIIAVAALGLSACASKQSTTDSASTVSTVGYSK